MNEIDHLAAEARERGSVQVLWARLRNGYFKAGTQEDGWAAAQVAFAQLGITARMENLGTPDRPEPWIVLTRRSA